MSSLANTGLNILRFKAITMLEAGFTQKKVARQLRKTLKVPVYLPPLFQK